MSKSRNNTNKNERNEDIKKEYLLQQTRKREVEEHCDMKRENEDIARREDDIPCDIEATIKRFRSSERKSYNLFVNEQLLVRVGNSIDDIQEERKQIVEFRHSFEKMYQVVKGLHKALLVQQNIDLGIRDAIKEHIEKALDDTATLLKGRCNVNALPYLLEYDNKFAVNYPQLLKMAQRYRYALFQSVFTTSYKENEQQKIAKAIQKGKIRKKPFSYLYPLPPLQMEIPSLLTIATHVVAAETLLNPRPFAYSLFNLPSDLLDLVLLKIATDSESGYSTLYKLSCYGIEDQMIPALAWIDAARAGEKRTREFTYKIFLQDTDFQIPLIDVFSHIRTFVIAPHNEFEDTITTFFPQPRPKAGVSSIVNKSQFLLQFSALTRGIFENFDFSNIVVVGESVIGSLLPIIKYKNTNYTPEEYYAGPSPFRASTIDLCICELSEEKFKEKLTQIYTHLKKVHGEREVKIYKSNSHVIFSALHPFRHIQVSLTSYRNLSHVLTDVDIDCEAFAFDGKTLWASQRARLAVNYRWTIAEPELFKIASSPHYEIKLLQYADRGFTIVDRCFHQYKPLPKMAPKKFKLPKYISAFLLKDRVALKYTGASLVYAMNKWSEVADTMREVSRQVFPYSPDVGFQQLAIYLETFGIIAHAYELPELCPAEITVDNLPQDNPLAREAIPHGYTEYGWYSDLEEKTGEEEEEIKT